MAETYDVITIGGGLAGAALAKRLAENGMRVLVLEREVAFRDRVRGEQMHCWGDRRSPDARALRAAAGDLRPRSPLLVRPTRGLLGIGAAGSCKDLAASCRIPQLLSPGHAIGRHRRGGAAGRWYGAARASSSWSQTGCLEFAFMRTEMAKGFIALVSSWGPTAAIPSVVGGAASTSSVIRRHGHRRTFDGGPCGSRGSDERFCKSAPQHALA